MKTLELNQMEELIGGDCEGQVAAFGLATLSVAASLVAGPIGFAIASASLALAIYNLEQCRKNEALRNQ